MSSKQDYLSTQRKEKRRHEERRQRRKHRLMGWAMVAVCVAILAAGGFFGVNALLDAGTFIRSSVSFKSEHFSVNNAMLAYVFGDVYSADLEENLSSYKIKGLDTEKSLRQQSYDDKQTWFEYFMDKVTSSVSNQLLYAEAALSEGRQLTEADEASITQYLDSLHEYAQKNDDSYTAYISKTYGRGVTDEDIRDWLRIATLASAYYDNTFSKTDITDEQINAYYEEHKQEYQRIDYQFYSFDTQKAADAAQKAAEFERDIKQNGFEKALSDYVRSTDTTATDETIAAALKSATVTEEAYDEENAIATWAFDDARAEGDTTTMQDDTVYYVLRLMRTKYRTEARTCAVRHILLSPETEENATEAEKAAADQKVAKQAEELYAQWKASGATEEAFAELAKKNSKDGSAANGGLMEGITPGQTVTAFNDWCFATARKAGDSGIVKTEYGYHLVYMSSTQEQWIPDIKEALQNARYTEQYDALQKAYTVSHNDAEAAKIPWQ